MGDTRYKATIGADFMTKDVEINGQGVTLQIWDTAGQERFESLGAAFYRGADAAVLVYDITKPKSFESLENWKAKFLNHAGPRNPESFPFVVLGNMIDKADERRVAEEKAKLWCEPQNISYFETSAKDGTNIDEAFNHIAQLALKQGEEDEEVYIPPTLKVTQEVQEDACGGC